MFISMEMQLHDLTILIFFSFFDRRFGIPGSGILFSELWVFLSKTFMQFCKFCAMAALLGGDFAINLKFRKCLNGA
jgi:hypothetical protein